MYFYLDIPVIFKTQILPIGVTPLPLHIFNGFSSQFFYFFVEVKISYCSRSLEK